MSRRVELLGNTHFPRVSFSSIWRMVYIIFQFLVRKATYIRFGGGIVVPCLWMLGVKRTSRSKQGRRLQTT